MNTPKNSPPGGPKALVDGQVEKLRKRVLG